MVKGVTWALTFKKASAFSYAGRAINTPSKAAMNIDLKIMIAFTLPKEWTRLKD
jgi:hypothetical protein